MIKGIVIINRGGTIFLNITGFVYILINTQYINNTNSE